MPNPTTGGAATDVSNLVPTDLLTAGTTSFNNLTTILNSVATGLASLQAVNQPVILRPLPEGNGNRFWWGTNFLSDAQYVSLWQFIYNDLTQTKGLTNLLWLYAVNAGIAALPNSRYPGSAYVDVVGVDLYTSTPLNGQNDYTYLLGFGKPVGLSVFSPGSSQAGDTTFNEPTLVSAISVQMPKIVFWQQWWDANSGNPGWGMAETQNVAAALSDPRVLNRPLSFTGTVAPTPPPTSAPTTYITPGNGSFTDSAGNVYSIDTGRNALENGSAIPGGAGTSAMEYFGGQVYGQDAATGQWFSCLPPFVSRFGVAVSAEIDRPGGRSHGA